MGEGSPWVFRLGCLDWSFCLESSEGGRIDTRDVTKMTVLKHQKSYVFWNLDGKLKPTDSLRINKSCSLCLRITLKVTDNPWRERATRIPSLMKQCALISEDNERN